MSGIFNILDNRIKELAVSRFEKPTLVQELAIPKVLEGKNILVIAETGSGKTESIMLSLFNKLIEKEHKPFALLYLTPMRALNRDLLDRLLWWCNKLDIDISVRHGDTTQYERKIQVEHPSHILISTPEQINAMLVGKRLREHLKNIKYIVVDEIHEIVNSKRGVQLTLSLERLKRYCGIPQIIALSATVGSPEIAAKFVFSDKSYEIINAISPKDMQIKVESPYPNKEDKIIAEKIFIGDSVVARLRRIRDLILEHRSTLAFTNTREAAEILSSRLRLFDKSLQHEIHHSSLSKEVRIKAEKDFKEEKLKSIICVSGDTNILLAGGSWKTINDIYENNLRITSLNTNLKLEPDKTSKIIKTGIEKTVKVITKHGFELECTKEHQFLTINDGNLEWIKAQDLKAGQNVAIIRQNPFEPKEKSFYSILPDNLYVQISDRFFNKIKQAIKEKYKKYEDLSLEIGINLSNLRHFLAGKKTNQTIGRLREIIKKLNINPEELYNEIILVGSRNYTRYIIPQKISPAFCRSIGFLLADGTITRRNRIRFFNKNRNLLKKYIDILKNEFNINTSILNGPYTLVAQCYATWLSNILKNIGVKLGRKARIIEIPKIIFQLPKKHQLEFLGGYFDGDGCFQNFHGRTYSMLFTTFSKKMAQDLQLLLLSLGIVTSIRHTEKKNDYVVTILGGEHLRKFISMCEIWKDKTKLNISNYGYTHKDTIPSIGILLKNLRLKAGVSTYFMQMDKGLNPYRYEIDDRSISRQQLLDLIKIYAEYEKISKILTSLATSDIFWDNIKKIERGKTCKVYDILNTKNSNFIANGFIVHNCTSSLQLGLDIGSIDIVLQYQSPRTVTQATQRIGRSGHGVGRISKGIIIAGEGDDIFESAVIAKKALIGELEPLKIHKNSLDVLTQQLIGLAIEDYNIDPKLAFELFKKAYPFKDLKEEEFNSLVNFLDNQLRLVFSDNGIKRRRKAFEYYFENLSVIPDQKSYKVIDTTSNSFVGTLDEEFIASHGETGSSFIVKGRPWKILSIENEKVFVEAVDDIESAIPAWEGELIPVPFEVAQGVGILRREIKKMLEEKIKSEEIIEIVKKNYPVSSQAAVKMIQLIKKQIKKCPLPDEKSILIEKYQDYIVLHTLFGSLVNETFSRFITAILSAEHGEIITSKTDPYRIIIKGCSIEDVKKILFDYKPEDIEIILEKSLPRSSLFKFRFIHVAKRFGAISKKASFDTINIDRIIDVYWNSPIHKETLQELFTEKLDLEKTKEILEKIQKNEIKINNFEGLSPLAELGFRYELQDVARPNRPEKEIFKIFKNRLLNSKVRLLCINCGKYSIVETVKDIKELRCRLCQSKLIAVLKPHREEAQKIVKKWLKGLELSDEEKEKLEFIKKSADLAIVYDKDAALALAGRGVGPQTATRILSKPRRNEDDLFKYILEAEREFIKNKKYWQ